MIESSFGWFIKKRLLNKWKKRKKRWKNITLKLKDIHDFFEKLETHNISYVVLRWFDEVPLTKMDEKNFSEKNDIDLLVDTKDINKLASIASKHYGKIKCDIYNVKGGRGLSYNKFPYYPPVLASKILGNRELYNDVFYVPCPQHHFKSLAYHLVYHKGLDSGIPTGAEIQTKPNPKRNYGKHLQQLGDKLALDIPKPYTLLNLHNYLVQNKWDMTYDLIERWPNKTLWHEYLLKCHIEDLKPWAEKLPHLLIFFIRQDMVDSGRVESICDMVEEKFEILMKQQLNQRQVEDIGFKVRGGNWTSNKDNKVIPASVAIICYDHNPVEMSAKDTKYNELYPKVRNKNIFHKHEIRRRLASDKTFNKILSSGVHSCDNHLEAQHMLSAIFPEMYEQINRELFSRIFKIL